MTAREMQQAFEMELNVLYGDKFKPTSDTTLYWLNQAVLKFVKTRYSGTNAKVAAFEQNQKRIDDLRTLVARQSYNWENGLSGSPAINIYTVILPDDYMFQIGTTVGIQPNVLVDGKKNPHSHCWQKDDSGKYIVRNTDAIEVTHDTLDRELENSLSEMNIHYCSAKPLKLISGNQILFYTDKYYQLASVQLQYIKMPKAITLDQPFVNYTQLPEHTHLEIVKLAVQMYLESIADQRYTSYSNEVNTME